MDIDVKSIIVLLATQAMINLGEIKDPITGAAKDDPAGAYVFIQLLVVLEEKTRGNLSAEEEAFLSEIKTNLDAVYKKKTNAGN